MRAMYVVRDGDGGRFEARDVPRPEPGPGQMLVKIRATSLNRGELMISRIGAMIGDGKLFGADFAGEVEQVGEGVAGFAPGDRVMGSSAGTFAEEVIADQRLTAPIPEGVSFADAAAFTTVYMTSHDALVTNGGLKPGEAVLVNAVSSGVGIAAVQIAKLMGAGQVIGVSRSAEKLAAVRGHGLTGEVDLSRDRMPEVVMGLTEGRGVDLIADSVGASALADNLASMALAGRLVQIGRLGGAVAEIDLDFLALRRLHLIGVTFRTRSLEQKIACFQACMRDLAPAWRTGTIRPPIDRSFPLERISEARDYIERDAHVGKIVIEV